MNLENIHGAARIDSRFEFKLGELSLKLGRRQMVAMEIVDGNWTRYTNSEEYKSNLFEYYKQLNEDIKELLFIDK